MTDLLIENGENVNGRDPIGWPPLLLAIHKRDIHVIEYLIAHGAKVNDDGYVLKELHVCVQVSSRFQRLNKFFA